MFAIGQREGASIALLLFIAECQADFLQDKNPTDGYVVMKGTANERHDFLILNPMHSNTSFGIEVPQALNNLQIEI